MPTEQAGLGSPLANARQTIMALAIAIVLFVAWFVVGGSNPDTNVPQTALIEVMSGEFQFSDAVLPPDGRWFRHTIPSRSLRAADGQNRRADATIWLRLPFTAKEPSREPIAFVAQAIEQNYAVFLNGKELYRSADPSDRRSMGWNHPFYLQLPAALIEPGDNFLYLRISANKPQPLVLGPLRLGHPEAARQVFDRANLLNFVAPEIISGYLLVLTFGAMTFWIRRPRETIFGWQALLGAVWIFRNLHFFVQRPPFDATWFWSLSTDSTFVLLVCAFAFAIRFFELPHPRRLSWLLLGSCVGEIALRHGLVALEFSDFPAFALTLPVTVVFMTLCARSCLAQRKSDRWLVFGALALAIAFSFHDLIRSIDVWPGAGLSLQPFGGLLLFSAFDIVLTSRLQSALVAVEDVNERLDARVTEVTHNLRVSEASRVALQVSSAVDQERDRIMREIHDGIGSNLVTALAQAQRRTVPGGTVAVLRKSITDLKIAVDSLEPVDGDLIVLLASLRHRMEGDLAAAGVATVWKVEPCPPLPWLNPVNALHILRIMQETFGNVVAHANASTLTVGCAPTQRKGQDGIQVSVTDDGDGARRADFSAGRGIGNMRGRAEALNGFYSFEVILGRGSKSTLWIPL